MMPMMTTETDLPVRILVAEDDAIVSRDVREALREMGYRVVDVVSTGAAAVRASRKHRPDLVLMDIRMPGPLDGIEAADRIGDESGTPVIYLTAYSDDRTLERAGRTDPRAYLLKPFDGRELRAAGELAVRRPRREDRVATAGEEVSEPTGEAATPDVADPSGRAEGFADTLAGLAPRKSSPGSTDARST